MAHKLDVSANVSKHFKRREFACKCGCGFSTVDGELLLVLESIRSYFNEPVTINSACRCPMHNANEGGRPNSAHLMGIAADIVVKNVSPERVESFLMEMYPDRYGRKGYNTFTHIDVREPFAHW